MTFENQIWLAYAMMGAAIATGLFATGVGRSDLAAINAIIVLANVTLIWLIRKWER
jgi:hypothetical protein